MASGVHTATYPHPPPTFSQHAHSSSLNAGYSAPPLSSFEAHSVHSTPAPTPPPPRQMSQQQMVYAMSGPPMANGVVPSNSYTPYHDPNLFAQPQYYANGAKPQIYTAVYSNVSVFEMEVNGVAVMRRRADSWLNATQILKVAGVDKGKRTKVLEKEILTGEHEKVQGGYGKYQGTWINYQRGREFCRQYGVEQLLLPLLEYDISSDGMPNMQQGLETPTKEQAMAAQRKRMYGGDNRNIPQSNSGTFFKNMSTTAANAINALNRTRLDSPSRMDGRRSIGPRRPSQQPQPFSQDSMFAPASQQSMHSLASQDSFGANGGVLSQGASFAEFPAPDLQEPPRKRIRPSPQNSFLNNFDGNLELSMQQGSPTEPNQSFFSQHDHSFTGVQPIYYGVEPLPHPTGPLEEQKKDLLLDLFIDPSRTDFDDHPAFLRLSGDEFELPIDGSCNTALHWAATLARISLVRKLLERGFNMRRTNSGGETALIAACQARNNLDHNSFPALLDHLGSTIEIRDGRGRTLLHHLAVSSAMKGRAAVGRYYLESLLEYVVKQGSVSNSQTSHFDGVNGSNTNTTTPMTLARFMSEVVNTQDKAGDTALNLAARTSTTTIIDQLIEVGADPHIRNRGGLAPVDFGVGDDMNTNLPEHEPNLFDAVLAGIDSSTKSVEEAREGMMSSFRDLLSQSETDFANELKEKKEVLDKTNAALKESGALLAEERKRLEELQAKAREKEELEQKISNLRRSADNIRSELIQRQPNNPRLQENIRIGEADKGLDFESRLNAIESVFPGVIGPEVPTMSLTPQQTQFLSTLERAEVMSGRAQAYIKHNNALEQTAKTLKARSNELEERYKRIVSLCTGADVDRVDELLDGLVQAVISEQKETSSGGLELGRVREFLRLVNDGRA